MIERMNFFSPTKLYFDENVSNIGDIIHAYGYSNILLVYGKNSIKSNGLYDVIISSLAKSSINYLELSGIRANPTIEKVLEGVEIAKTNKIDFILAVGGGSVIDTAKSIAVGYFYEGNTFDFNKHLSTPIKALPIGVILTTAAAGSEMSSSCVIQDDSNGIKQGFNSDLVRPLFCIENKEIISKVNDYQLSCGIVDIMMHTFERYFSESSKYELADNLAIGLLKTMKNAGIAAFLDRKDQDAMFAIMVCSSISHNNTTSIGKRYKMPVHFLEHIVSGAYPSVIHGAGLAVLFPVWCEQNIDVFSHKMSILAKELFALSFKNDLEGAKLFIENIRELFTSLGMPSKLKDIDVNISLEKLLEQFDFNDIRAVNQKAKMFDRKTAEDIFERCI